MRSGDRVEIEADYAALHEIVSRIVGHTYDAFTTPERLTFENSQSRIEAGQMPFSGG
jgi:hypothetical protein